MRGLKFEIMELLHGMYQVAPHMGAWIEIRWEKGENEIKLVAPHMGAWIEITLFCVNFTNLLVAPHMGAWIEILNNAILQSYFIGSHPTWVRGLKFGIIQNIPQLLTSHPTWVRGLK